MDSKTLWAVVLSMLILVGFQFFFAREAPKPQAPAPQMANAPVANGASAQALGASAPSGPVMAPTGAVPEKFLNVDNTLFKARFSTRGAVPVAWVLKKYKDSKGRDVSLLQAGTPPALAIGWAGSFKGADLDFSTPSTDLVLSRENPKGTLAFDYSSGGISIRRTYTFYYNAYHVDMKDEVSGLPDYQITLGPEFGIFSREESRGVHVGPALLTGMKLEELAPNKLSPPKVFTNELKWIANEDKYFFAGLVPKSPVADAKAWEQDGYGLIGFQAAHPSVEKFLLYAGPKQMDRLKALGVGLENIIDYGWFSIIARPILWLLKKIYSVVGNYGFAIIILTIMTRIPFIPLVNKGQRSMKKLQALQPKIAEIRQQYKKDPQRMQQETMALYKKYKVNPMGGCLPILIQIPVFFALYKVLLISIELRGAPFALWITDLSAKDPYYVLPIVMGITMLIQQVLTPSGGDPTQRKMMMIMPVVFTFLFLKLASGLVLYWFVSNLFSILQQMYVNSKLKHETA